MSENQSKAIFLSILAAALYAVSTPVSKYMLNMVPPTMIAAFLYLGAGLGVGAMMLLRNRFRVRHYKTRREDFISKTDNIVLNTYITLQQKKMINL